MTVTFSVVAEVKEYSKSQADRYAKMVTYPKRYLCREAGGERAAAPDNHGGVSGNEC